MGKTVPMCTDRNIVNNILRITKTLRPTFFDPEFRTVPRLEIRGGRGGIKEGLFIKESFALSGFTIQYRYYWFSTSTIQVRYSCIRPANMALRTAAL